AAGDPSCNTFVSGSDRRERTAVAVRRGFRYGAGLPLGKRGRRSLMPFSQFHLHPDLLRGVKEMGFTRPTPIQEKSIPPAMEGHDLLACAMTGSGKTAAFLLPILHRLIAKPRGGTRALILTPTRELAAQIDEHLREIAVHTPL